MPLIPYVTRLDGERVVALNELLTLLLAVPDIPSPSISDDKVAISLYPSWYDSPEEVISEVKRVSKSIGGSWWKNDPKAGSFAASYYELTHDHQFGPYKLIIRTERASVCEPVVVRTEVVHVEAKPAVEAHDEEKPVLEWVCKPLNDAPSPLGDFEAKPLETAAS